VKQVQVGAKKARERRWSSSHCVFLKQRLVVGASTS